MGSQLEDSRCVSCKSGKLAGVEARPLLGAPAPEPDDSGIDSDEPSPRGAALALQVRLDEESSSDEEAPDKPRAYKQMSVDEQMKDMSEVREKLDYLIKMQSGAFDKIMEPSVPSEDLDRSSPPLYEVELTASDEDDDASVLELVIPMQSRYQRVPTSSPKKNKPKTRCFVCQLLCCVRKN